MPLGATRPHDADDPPADPVAAGEPWPTPPFACYPRLDGAAAPFACEVEGAAGSRTAGRLAGFLPAERVALVIVAPSRTAMPLRFDQFRRLTLTEPLRALEAAASDPHAEMLQPRAASAYRVVATRGEGWSGETIGHVENEAGLFLFPPADAAGSVLRAFIPRSAYRGFEIGPRIGEVLVAQKATTDEQVERAMEVQQQLRNQKLGDILVARRIVTPEQLLEAIERQARMPIVRIGEALASLGLVSDAQLADALAQQRTDRSVPLGELLVRMGAVSRDDLQVALARKMGYPLVEIDEFPAEVTALRSLGYGVAMRLQMMPLLLRAGRLVVALDDPARRRSAVDEAEFVSQLKVVPVLAQCASIEDTITRAFEKIGASSAPSRGDAPVSDDAEAASDTGRLIETLEREGLEHASGEDERPIEQSDNSLVRLINNMIVEAFREGVSDIHVESYPARQKTRIRFRKDGALRTYLELSPNYRNALIARIKIMCDLDISERRKPQDGKINFSKFSPAHRIELRVATIPTSGGLEDVVMRILASAKPLPIDKLGLSAWNLAQMKAAVERPYGMVLCVGPTGSGKTTTLHSVLSHINTPQRKIWTAEDPVEITQAGLRQVQVNPRIDWTFAKALRAFLRADPDVIMVGEMRDKETAQTAIEASLTGHLVLSTLHTNSAPETVTRLLDMGMDPFNFADSLLAVLAQRLVRRLCTNCRIAEPAAEAQVGEWLDEYARGFGGEAIVARDALRADWLARHGRDGRLLRYRVVGCKQCDATGYKGRIGVHELMITSRELRRLVQTGARAEALQAQAMREGMRTLRQDGLDKVLAGLTSIEEVRATSNA